MKICYLYLAGYASLKSGVDNKVIGKCAELMKLFPGSKCIRLTTQKTSVADDFFESCYVETEQKKYFQTKQYNKALFATVDQLIESHKGAYDFYLVRYPFASRPLLRLTKKHKGKIVFEHNTNEQSELAVVVNGNKKKIPFSFHPSVLAYYLESIWFAVSRERALGAATLANAAGGIAVTPEIAGIEKKQYSSYKTVVITNGISTDERPVLNRKPDPELNAVFLAGTNAEWNGIERIIDSYEASEARQRIRLYFVGRFDTALKNKYRSDRVLFLDYMSRTELHGFLEKMHFAMGTCAIHKKGLKEGAVLKVREYFAAGLPVMLGHTDPYIEQIPELKKYCITFPADDSPIDFSLVEKMMRELYAEPTINTNIQAQGNRYFSWNEVLKPLPAFLQELQVNQKTSRSSIDQTVKN